MTQPEYGQPEPQPSPYQNQPHPQGTPSYGYGQPEGQPSYGYQPAEHPQAQVVFILGIVGIFFTLAAFVAWYLGAQARKEIQSGAPYPFEGKLKTGYWLGKIISILAIIAIVLSIIALVVGLLAVGASAGY